MAAALTGAPRHGVRDARGGSINPSGFLFSARLT